MTYVRGKRVRIGNAYLKAREKMFAKYGDVCHICGHPGARQADHLVPLRENPNQPIGADGMRPAHGAGRPDNDNPCPTCGRRCNQQRGSKSLNSQIGKDGFKPSREW